MIFGLIMLLNGWQIAGLIALGVTALACAVLSIAFPATAGITFAVGKITLTVFQAVAFGGGFVGGSLLVRGIFQDVSEQRAAAYNQFVNENQLPDDYDQDAIEADSKEKAEQDIKDFFDSENGPISPEVVEGTSGAKTSLVATAPQPVEAVQQAAKASNAAAQDEALNKYLEQLAQLNDAESKIRDDQANNLIENPFKDDTFTDKEKEETSEKVVKEFENAKETMDFNRSDFDNLDGYSWMINGVPVKMYVKSNINIMSEDEDFSALAFTKINSTKYVDEKGQTHAVATAYDADGNALDKTIWSEQIGYLEYGKDGAYGYAKFQSEGTTISYEFSGYGENKFSTTTKGTKVYFDGNAEFIDKEKQKKSVLGTNSTIVAKKEYSFRDEVTINFTSDDTSSIADGYKAAIIWGANIMRDVNIDSFVLDMGDVELVIDTTTNKEKTEKVSQNDIDYTYNGNALVTDKTSGATYKAKDIIDNDIMTMEELIEKGFTPTTINGEKFNSKEDLQSAVTAAKPSFTIQVDDPVAPENFEREIFYTADNGTKYFFTTKCSHRYHIVTEDGTIYSLQDALKIYTIQELINAGLDCKSSVL